MKLILALALIALAPAAQGRDLFNFQSLGFSNDGKYYAFITAYDNELKKGDSANPVKTLRMRYNAWVKAGARRTDPPGPTPYKP